jgi:hypothetical protein
MALPTTATLVYTVTPTNTTAAKLSAALQAIPLYTNPATDPTLQGLFGVTVASDTPTVGPPCVRTIVLTLSPAFFALFPSVASWAGAFNGLYTRTIANALSTDAPQLVESPVVFA